MYGINRPWPILDTLLMFARKDCGSHRFTSIGVVGFKGDVHRMRKRYATV